MAQRIQLTGYQGPRGFNPEQVYDPSAQMQRAAQQDAQIREESLNSYREVIERVGRNVDANQKANLEALSGFSSTLSTFLVDFQKKQNEREYNLGLSEVMNGNVQLPSETIQQHNSNVEILKQSADADTETAKAIETQGNTELAAEVRGKSKAIKGWRAYGQAVGSAKLAASNIQGFLTSFMDGTEFVVPLPDGRLISPSEAKTPSEINAALAVGQQEFFKKQGLSKINPLVLAEHLAPTLQAVKGQILSNQLSEVTRKERETAIDRTDSLISADFSNPQINEADMSASFQMFTLEYAREGNLSLGAASDRAVDRAIEAIKTLPKEIADDLLLKLANVPKIKDDPNSIKLGIAYSDKFNQAVNAIEDQAEATEQRRLRSLDTQAQQSIAVLERARQDATISQPELKKLRTATIQTLGILADQGSTKALSARADLLAEPANLNYKLYRQYREGIAQGKRPSKDQLQQDFLAGRLSANMVDELDDYATGSDRSDFMKQNEDLIRRSVVSHLKQAGAVSLNPVGQPVNHVLHVQQIGNDLADLAYKFYDAKRQQGVTLTDNDINQFILNQIPRVVGKYFSQDKTTKKWTPRPITKNPALSPSNIKSTIRGYVPDAGGFDPRTIQLRSLNSGNATLLSQAEVEDNIQRLQNKQPPSGRAATLALSNGGLIQLLTHQAQHYGLDPSPIANSPQAQRLAELRKLAPRAAERLVSSNNYLGQMLQLQKLAEAQQRAARLQSPENTNQPSDGLKPGSQLGITDYLKLGLQQGLDPEKAILMAAVGMAESTGNSGVVNDNPNTGDLSYGAWQINMIDKLGPTRRVQYGLKSNDDLKDPETNARVMANILRSSGVSAWGAFNDRRYLQYMSEARRAYADLKKSGGL